MSPEKSGTSVKQNTKYVLALNEKIGLDRAPVFLSVNKTLRPLTTEE